jgi:hypothetical protein
VGNEDNVGGGYKLGLYTNDKVEFEVRNGANAPFLNRAATGGTVLSAGQWYHVAGRYNDSNDSIQTFVNGVLDRTTSTAGVLAKSNGQLIIGREPFSSTAFFNGRIEDLKIYDRALSDAEINADFNRWKTAHYYSKIYSSNALYGRQTSDWNYLDVDANVFAPAQRVTFQARSCETADCNNNAFVGPGGLATTFFDYNFDNPVKLDGIPTNRFFQYKLYLDFNNAGMDYSSLPRVSLADLNAGPDTNAPVVHLIYPIDGNGVVVYYPRLHFTITDDGPMDWSTFVLTIDGNLVRYPDANLSCQTTISGFYAFDCNFDTNQLYDGRHSWSVDVNDVSSNRGFASATFMVLRVRDRLTLQIARRSMFNFDANVFVHAFEPYFVPWALKFVGPDWNAPAMSPDANDLLAAIGDQPGSGNVYYWKLGPLEFDQNDRVVFDLNSSLLDYNLSKAWIVGG